MKENLSTDDEVLCKSKSSMKWIILILASLALLGDYYCFDNPGAMHSQLLKRFGNENGENFEYTFNLMYSVYSLPNIILPLIGGIMIFQFGYRTMFVVFGSCVLIGQLVFAMGCSTKSIPTMLVGRIIFGLGGESLNTTQYAIIVQWFAMNELGFAMGLCLSLARLGNVLNDTADVCSAMWLGFAVCAFSFICTILLVYLDWRQDILIQMREIVTSNNTIMVQEEEEKSYDAIKNLPKIYFLMIIYCMLMYAGILPFNYIATSFLIRTWYNNVPTVEAQHNVGMAMALPFLISSIIIPFIGITVDKLGKRGHLMIFSSLLGILTYLLFIFISPIFPLVLLGFTYAIFASVFWPALTLLVPKNLVGIALGLATSLQNLGLVFVPMIVAFIFTKSQSYDITLIFFIVILSAALIVSVMIDFEDHKLNRILHLVHIEIIPKQQMNKSNFLSRSLKQDKEALIVHDDKNEEEVRLLKIKELF